MKTFFIKILILFLSFFCFITKVNSAEVLQISSSTVLQIGDNNRTYTVKLACAEISPDLEEKSVNWLKSQLPRHTKVNLRPKGTLNGILIAKVIPFNSNDDISERYINEGLAKNIC